MCIETKISSRTWTVIGKEGERERDKKKNYATCFYSVLGSLPSQRESHPLSFFCCKMDQGHWVHLFGWKKEILQCIEHICMMTRNIATSQKTREREYKYKTHLFLFLFCVLVRVSTMGRLPFYQRVWRRLSKYILATFFFLPSSSTFNCHFLLLWGHLFIEWWSGMGERERKGIFIGRLTSAINIKPRGPTPDGESTQQMQVRRKRSCEKESKEMIHRLFSPLTPKEVTR